MSVASIIPDAIREYFRYDDKVGDLVWAKCRPRGRRRIGDLAGSAQKDGYRSVKFGSARYQSHRVIWFLVTGEQPSETIDHRDCNRSNNRFENLRPATHSENSSNRRPNAERCLPKGVAFNGSVGKFQAQITVHGAGLYLGLYETAEEAHAAYAAAAYRLHGKFARVA